MRGPGWSLDMLAFGPGVPSPGFWAPGRCSARRVLGDCGSVLRGLTEGQPILFPEDEVQSRVSSSPVLNPSVTLVGADGKVPDPVPAGLGARPVAVAGADGLDSQPAGHGLQASEGFGEFLEGGCVLLVLCGLVAVGFGQCGSPGGCWMLVLLGWVPASLLPRVLAGCRSARFAGDRAGCRSARFAGDRAGCRSARFAGDRAGVRAARFAGDRAGGAVF